MKLNQIRIVLIVAIVMLFMALSTKWQEMFHTPLPSEKTTATQQVKNNAKVAPTLASTNTSKIKTGEINYNAEKPILIKTDLLNIEISPINGAIISAKLLKYNVSIKDKTPLTLLNNDKTSLYIAQSNIFSSSLPQGAIIYKTAKSSYNIKGENKLVVSLSAKINNIDLIKQFIFTKGSYAIKVKQKLINNSDKTITGFFSNKLQRIDPTTNSSGLTSLIDVHSYSFNGAVLSSNQNHYQKESYKNMKSEPTKIVSTQGWAAMVQHYFISAWIPENSTKGQQNTFFANSTTNNTFTSGFNSPNFTVTPNSQINENSQLYVGPTIKKDLNAVAPNLGLTVDYGFLWFFSDIIFYVMAWIYTFVGNWGLAIILVTFLIKLLFYPLSAKSYRSMAKMRLLQPKIKQLKERHGDDKQKMTQQMMQMYKREKVNPVGGCLPMVIQIPVFIALYWVLLESVQLRQAPFYFWIYDLSMKDPYYILPILMGISMFFQQKLNPTSPDPTQAKIMMFLPVIFTVMFLNFPSGLVLYWLTNNVLGIMQQWLITKKIANEAKHGYTPPPKKSIIQNIIGLIKNKK